MSETKSVAIRQREHTAGDQIVILVGRAGDEVICVSFRNEGLYSLMTVNAGSSQGIKLRPGQEEVFSVPAGYRLNTSFKVSYTYENQNPVQADGSKSPTVPNGNSTDAIHLGIITEMYVTS